MNAGILPVDVSCNYWFRFERLNADQAERLRAVCRIEGVEIRKRYDGDGFGAAFSIHERDDVEWIMEFLREQKIEAGTYGVSVSIVTDARSTIVRTPRFVVDVAAKLDANLDFSYTIVSKRRS